VTLAVAKLDTYASVSLHSSKYQALQPQVSLRLILDETDPW